MDNQNDLPLVLTKRDPGSFLNLLERTIDHLHNAKLLPVPLIDEAARGRRKRRITRWTRGSILDWMESGSLRRRR